MTRPAHGDQGEAKAAEINPATIAVSPMIQIGGLLDRGKLSGDPSTGPGGGSTTSIASSARDGRDWHPRPARAALGTHRGGHARSAKRFGAYVAERQQEAGIRRHSLPIPRGPPRQVFAVPSQG